MRRSIGVTETIILISVCIPLTKTSYSFCFSCSLRIMYTLALPSLDFVLDIFLFDLLCKDEWSEILSMLALV
jgi:hypothetical protein